VGPLLGVIFRLTARIRGRRVNWVGLNLIASGYAYLDLILLKSLCQSQTMGS